MWFNFMCEFKICLVTPSWHFNKHRVIFAIKTFLIFQDWLALIVCWSLIKYFTKITFERNISSFQDKNKIKNKTQFIEYMWCILDIWKHIVAKYNVHSLDNCILFTPCQHFTSYWSLLKIEVTIWYVPLFFKNLICPLLT
jgi:hypothetical protein